MIIDANLYEPICHVNHYELYHHYDDEIYKYKYFHKKHLYQIALQTAMFPPFCETYIHGLNIMMQFEY